MTLQRHLVSIPFLLLAVHASAQVRVSDIEVKEGSVVEMTVQWSDGWNDAQSRDAAWVFLKWQRPRSSWPHVRIPGPVEVLGTSRPRCSAVTVPDGVGFFVEPSEAHAGDVSARVRVAVARPQGVAVDAKPAAFAIPMVRIPAGSFWVGQPMGGAHLASLFSSVGEGKDGGPYQIRSEDTIQIGPEAGRLYYKAEGPHAQYEGDMQGALPPAFPKGTRAFYVMKHEITQGEYAAYLNAIGYEDAHQRAIQGGPFYTELRGTISISKGVYTAASPNRPANFTSWDDGTGFLDWAGLRPMTELEFEKAARGPGQPKAKEFPWGTDSVEGMQRVLHELGDLQEVPRSKGRLAQGASFYGVMDLAGSLWERCITIGHPAGRLFTGTHGDGRVTYGLANVADWPKGDVFGGGYGYRGGGHYEFPIQFTEFNPYSPISYRPYGSWGQGPRSVAYGLRGVRTAPEGP